MTRKRVVIIGAGFSGVCLAAHLARRGRKAPRTTLIDKAARFGLGLAYGTQDPAHLLNVRAPNMSAFADKPDDFSAWCARQGGISGDFAPRTMFGRYVQHILARSTGLFAPISRKRGRVIACVRAERGWRLTLEGGATLDADAVVLATGNRGAPPLAALEAARVAAIDPWDAHALHRMPSGDVLMIGTGLTMVDAALTLAAKRNGVIYALSRRGLLPRSHADRVSVQNAPIALPMPLSEALAAFRAEVEAAAAQGEPWQFVMDRLRPQTTELWRRLPVEAQRRFLRHLRPWWDVHRHRMAPPVAAQIAELQREGRLRLLAGELVSVAQRGRSLLVLHRQRGSMVRHRLEVAGIVNCTGGASDVRGFNDPLFQQMLRDGLMRACPNGLGLDIDEEGRVRDAAGAVQADLFTIGPPTQGALWESTAVPNIRVDAARLAQLL